MAKSGVINEIEKYLDEVKGKKSEELLFSCRGVMYPTGLCSAETFQALNTIEFRQDDVFLAAYPKCGTNWIQQILNDLINALPNNKAVSPTECIHVLEFEVSEKFQNLYGGVKQIAEFLGFSLPEEKIQSIAENATFQSMSNKSEETHGMFAPILFRKGAVGDWKNLFTEAQSQQMDAKFEECLVGTKLGANLKYDKHCKF